MIRILSFGGIRWYKLQLGQEVSLFFYFSFSAFLSCAASSVEPSCGNQTAVQSGQTTQCSLSTGQRATSILCFTYSEFALTIWTCKLVWSHRSSGIELKGNQKSCSGLLQNHAEIVPLFSWDAAAYLHLILCYKKFSWVIFQRHMNFLGLIFNFPNQATPALRFFLLVANSMAGQNSVYTWSRDHRFLLIINLDHTCQSVLWVQ